MLKHHKDVTIYVGTFSDELSVKSAYGAAKELLEDGSMTHTYDAAILSKDADGKAKVEDRHQEGVHQGFLAGSMVGIAGGLLMVLFPAVGFAAVLAGAGLGAGMGALAGHVVAGMSRKDLAEIGETLDAAEWALVVATDNEDRDLADRIFAGSTTLLVKDLRAAQE